MIQYLLRTCFYFHFMSYFNLMCLTLPGLLIQTNKGPIKTQIILKYISPILFCAHINDLPESVKSNVRLFADDCLLYRPIRFLAEQSCLQDDLNSLQDWAQKWCMNFNPSKCTVLHIIRTPPPPVKYTSMITNLKSRL